MRGDIKKSLFCLRNIFFSFFSLKGFRLHLTMKSYLGHVQFCSKISIFFSVLEGLGLAMSAYASGDPFSFRPSSSPRVCFFC